MDRRRGSFGYLEGVEPEGRDRLVPGGEDLQPVGKSLVPQQGPVLRLGGLDDEERDTAARDLSHQMKHGVGLARSRDPGDERVACQLVRAHPVGRGGYPLVLNQGAETEASGVGRLCHGVELWYLGDGEAVGLRVREVYVGGELGGEEQRLVLERVTVTAGGRLLDGVGQRPLRRPVLAHPPGPIHVRARTATARPRRFRATC